MGILSVHVCEDSILIADEEKAIGRLMKAMVHPVGLEAFLKTNYNLQGSVNYQSWLSGVLAGAVLIVGPPALPSEDQTAAATAGPDPEQLPGEIIVPGHTVHNGQVVQSVADVTAAAGTVIDDKNLSNMIDTLGEIAKNVGGSSVEPTGTAPAPDVEQKRLVPDGLPASNMRIDELTGDGSGTAAAPFVEAPASEVPAPAPAPEASGSGSP